MITVTTTLSARDEFILHANFCIALEQLRAPQNDACGTQTGPVTVTEPPVEPKTIAVATEDSTPVPVEATAGTPLDLSQIGVERTFRAFVTKVGTPAARALLDEYSATRLGDVKPEQLEAFVLRLVSA